MSDKPTILPDWTPTGLDVVVPSSGEKSGGHQPGNRPPAQHVNWFWTNAWLWIEWIKNGLWTRNDTTDDSPVIGYTDASGNIHNYIDPNGFYMGGAVNMHYVWPGLYSLAAAQSDDPITDDMLGETDTACIIVMKSPGLAGAGATKLNAVAIELRCQNAAVSQRVVINRAGAGSDSQFTDVDSLVVAMEFDLLLRTVGSDGVDVHMGLHGDPETNALNFSDGTAQSFVMFEKLAADTNWFAVNADTVASATREDTGTPPVVDTFQTFRIEFHGKDTPVGVANSTQPVARWFIDGVQEFERVNTNMPDEASGSLLDIVVRARADGTGPAADFNVQVGPIRYSYTTKLAPIVPA